MRGERQSTWGPHFGVLGVGRDPNRRESMAFSSMGYSHPSAQSLQSIGEAHPGRTNTLSFVCSVNSVLF